MRRSCLSRFLLAAFLPHLCFPHVAQARNSSEPRIAVCFWGLTRSLWATRDSLRNAVLDPLLGKGFRVEKYLHTYQLDHERGYDLAWESYRWLDIPDSHVILEKTQEADLDPETITLEAILNAPHGDPWNDNGQSVTNLRLALHSLRKVTSLWIPRADEFDVVMYARMDVWFFRQLDLTEVDQVINFPPSVFTPGWDHWGGYNDRFAFGDPVTMSSYGLRLRNMSEYIKEHKVHSEGLLRWVFDNEGVSPNTTSIRFSRVRASGKILTLPADPDEQHFSDDSHLPEWSLKRTPLGFLEISPCQEDCASIH